MVRKLRETDGLRFGNSIVVRTLPASLFFTPGARYLFIYLFLLLLNDNPVGGVFRRACAPYAQEVKFDEAHKSKTFSRDDGPFGIQYTFTLKDAVTDCDEWMVPKAAFVELAEEYGLELVEWRNFHDYVHNKLSGGSSGGGSGKPGEVSKDTAQTLWRTTMGCGSVEEATLSEDEWEVGTMFADI